MRNVLLLLGLCLIGCHKDLLDEKPVSTIVIPTTYADFWTLLDNDLVMDRTTGLAESSADDYFFFSDYWSTLSALERNSHIWAKDIYEGNGGVEDWNLPYSQVLNCNVVLEGLNKLDRNINPTLWDNTRGTALFKRAFAFYNVAQLFAQPYDSATAGTALGIPLKLTADVNSATTRSSVQQTYIQILSDLKEATWLLSQTLPDSIRNRPSRVAAYGLMSRVYLSMRDYVHAGSYADSCLQLNAQLIDYSMLNTASNTPFSIWNVENLYHTKVPFNAQMQSVLPSAGQAIIDTALVASYSAGDLRKILFFSSFSGNYVTRKAFYDPAIATLYTGVAVDEVLLNRAECYARKGLTDLAMGDLNRLLVNRYVKGLYSPPVISSSKEALVFILSERRKELVMRSLRWTDLRRLNIEGAMIVCHRIINGIHYDLLPNSNLYTLPIPPDVINTSHIQQNPR